MSGLVGLLQKTFDKDIYDIHVPLSAKELKKAHSSNEAILKKCEYFMSMNLSIVHASSLEGTIKNKIFRRALSVPTKLVWIAEKSGIRLPTNKFTSPYIIALAEKTPADE